MFLYAGVFKIIWSYDNNIILNNLFVTIINILYTSYISNFNYIYMLLKIIKERETLKDFK